MRDEINAVFATSKPLFDQQEEHLSPSGKYRLVVTPYETGKNTWQYTLGVIYDVEKSVQISEIKRNYSSFPFHWVENHPNGHSYFIGGEDYQGQTVIELDTGARKDHLPQGFGFCWAAYRFEPKHQMLIVDGCIWGGPYEFRFYDFSDPMAGWPEIKANREIQADSVWPKIEKDGTIKCVYMDNTEEVSSFFKRDGLEMIGINEVRGSRSFPSWMVHIVKEVEELAQDENLKVITYWDKEGEPEVEVYSKEDCGKGLSFMLCLGEESDGSYYGFTSIFTRGVVGGDHSDIDPTPESAVKALESYITKLNALKDKKD